MGNSFKSKLKYHRIPVIATVLIYITYMYSQRENKNTYENGQVKSTGQTEGGYNEGEWVWYHENGKRQMRGFFIRGKREGEWTTWNNQGVIQTIRNYKEDKLNGDFFDYDEKGEKIRQGKYQDDNVIWQ